MKNISIVECRNCGTQIVDGKDKLALDPGEEVDLIIRTIHHCSQCKYQEERTPSQKMPRKLKDSEW